MSMTNLRLTIKHSFDDNQLTTLFYTDDVIGVEICETPETLILKVYTKYNKRFTINICRLQSIEYILYTMNGEKIPGRIKITDEYDCQNAATVLTKMILDGVFPTEI